MAGRMNVFILAMFRISSEKTRTIFSCPTNIPSRYSAIEAAFPILFNDPPLGKELFAQAPLCNASKSLFVGVIDSRLGVLLPEPVGVIAASTVLEKNKITVIIILSIQFLLFLYLMYSLILMECASSGLIKFAWFDPCMCTAAA